MTGDGLQPVLQSLSLYLQLRLVSKAIETCCSHSVHLVIRRGGHGRRRDNDRVVKRKSLTHPITRSPDHSVVVVGPQYWLASHQHWEH